jgi:hypothetical protein
VVWWLALINSVAAIVTAAFGVAALARPNAFTPHGETTSRFFPALYAARAIPLGLGVAVAVWLPVTGMGAVALTVLLGVAALAQIGDIATGVVTRQPGLIGGAAFGALCHTAAAIVLIVLIAKP